MSDQPNFIFTNKLFRNKLLVIWYHLISKLKLEKAFMHYAHRKADINIISRRYFCDIYQINYVYISKKVSILINYMKRVFTPVTKIQNNFQLHSK